MCIKRILFKRLAKELLPYLTQPAKPFKLETLLLEETDMALVYKVLLPAVVDSDVVTRILNITVDGVSKSIEVAANAVDYTLSPVKEGALVELTIQDIDDVGNKSELSDVYSLVAHDTIVPTKPGQLHLKLVDEVPDEQIPSISPVKDSELEKHTSTTEIDPEPEIPVDTFLNDLNTGN